MILAASPTGKTGGATRKRSGARDRAATPGQTNCTAHLTRLSRVQPKTRPFSVPSGRRKVSAAFAF